MPLFGDFTLDDWFHVFEVVAVVVGFFWVRSVVKNELDKRKHR